MTELEKLLASARIAAADESRKIDLARRGLKRREADFARAMIELRSACDHPAAVEIRFSWVDRDAGMYPKDRAVGRRYCLGCGACEEANAYHLEGDRFSFQYRRLEKAPIVRNEHVHDHASHAALVDIFRERLHEMALFDEFDAGGVWRGEKPYDERHIELGTD